MRILARANVVQRTIRRLRQRSPVRGPGKLSWFLFLWGVVENHFERLEVAQTAAENELSHGGILLDDGAAVHGLSFEQHAAGLENVGEISAAGFPGGAQCGEPCLG